MIRFRSSGKELEDIISGKIKKISREIDRHNPVFKEIEELNGRVANGIPYGMIYIYDSEGISESKRISGVSYKDGCVIIRWN